MPGLPYPLPHCSETLEGVVAVAHFSSVVFWSWLAPAAFGLEKSFRASHAMLVLHTWLCLVRLRAEEQKEDAAEIGQTIYDLLNHDCEKRVVAAGVRARLATPQPSYCRSSGNHAPEIAVTALHFGLVVWILCPWTVQLPASSLLLRCAWLVRPPPTPGPFLQVTVLISKWMKELEKNFYGACLAYDGALKPEAPKGALESALWR